jgi:hypothetical protein
MREGLNKNLYNKRKTVYLKTKSLILVSNWEIIKWTILEFPTIKLILNYIKGSNLKTIKTLKRENVLEIITKTNWRQKFCSIYEKI